MCLSFMNYGTNDVNNEVKTLLAGTFLTERIKQNFITMLLSFTSARAQRRFPYSLRQS